MTEKELDSLRRIKRYDIIRPVGEGGMGKVYLAVDKIIRRPVAIKTFSLEKLGGNEDSRKKIMRDFFLETQTAGALLHPNIVVVYDVGKKRDLLYIVMEFVYGETLLDKHRSPGVSARHCIEIVYELALALDYAHSQGVVHRDIKPENVLLSPQGVPKITDFGIARFRKHLAERSETIVGSARFMAPEQVLRREQDHRVDVYQLGVVLFELLTRQSPFKGNTAEDTLTKVCNQVPPPPGRINPDLPEEIDWIVSRCLEKNPGKRFSRARDLADALAGCLRAGIHTVITADRDLVDRLRKFDMFSQFSDDEVEEIVDTGRFITCSPGEHIIQEHESDSNFFVLLEGNVEVVKGSRVLTDFLPGACFGEIGAFARQKRSAAVVAVEPCKLLQINAVLFRELDPELQLKMLHIVVRNMASLVMSLDDKIMELTEGTIGAKGMPTTCPLCGFEDHEPIEVCPRCGAIPSRHLEPSYRQNPIPEERSGAGRPTGDAESSVTTETMRNELWPATPESLFTESDETDEPCHTAELAISTEERENRQR